MISIHYHYYSDEYRTKWQTTERCPAKKVLAWENEILMFLQSTPTKATNMPSDVGYNVLAS